MRIFVTGASGWIGSAVVPELLAAGHHVTGLARSDASASALAEAGAEARPGSLDDLDELRDAAAAADGVLHLAFKHEQAFSGDFAGASAADRAAIEAFGAALEGTGKPLVIASGTATSAPGTILTEDMRPAPGPDAHPRRASEALALGLADAGVRSVSLRFPPTVHGEGDNGFMAMLVGIARNKGTAAYIGDGSNRWPAVHRSDAARLARLAVEAAPPGTVLHAVDDEGVMTGSITEVIGRHLELPVASIAPDESTEHFGWLGGFWGLDVPASSRRTRDLLGWEPAGPDLLDDLDAGHYFEPAHAGSH